MKKAICVIIALILLSSTALASGNEACFDFTDDAAVDTSIFADEAAPAIGETIDISAPSAILMEKETGTVLFEKDADKKMEPASVTKVMTILLITEAIERGDLSLDDIITCSTRASSMGGSRVYLKEGEQMSLRDMLKSIVVSSANDAAVAVAEHLYGTEAEFVSHMNKRAEELGMVNTHFNNCTGLMDDSEHLTTARDIAIMSRELISHDMIKEFTTIWMDTIRGGQFGLSNTNKLIYYYNGATGLKTGFTSRSMYCLSATAMRDGVEYIAVIMHGETSSKRFEDAKTLLNYGFANFTLANTSPDEPLPPIPVTLGTSGTVQPVTAEHTNMLVPKNDAKNITKTVELTDSVHAPVAAGDVLGKVTVAKGEEELCSYDIVAADNVPKLSFGAIFLSFINLLYENAF